MSFLGSLRRLRDAAWFRAAPRRGAVLGWRPPKSPPKEPPPSVLGDGKIEVPVGDILKSKKVQANVEAAKKLRCLECGGRNGRHAARCEAELRENIRAHVAAQAAKRLEEAMDTAGQDRHLYVPGVVDNECARCNMPPTAQVHETQYVHVSSKEGRWPPGKQPEALPCPFCGSLELDMRGDFQRDLAFVRCAACEARGPVVLGNANRAHMVERWNTKSSPNMMDYSTLKVGEGTRWGAELYSLCGLHSLYYPAGGACPRCSGRREGDRLRPKNRVLEAMTQAQVGKWRVRTWVTTSGMSRGPIAEVYAKLEPFCRLQVVGAEQIAEALERVENIAAYEVTDEKGNGIVVYPDWH